MELISPKKLKEKLDKNEIYLIDVREEVEHKNESIEGSYLIPLSNINAKNLPSTTKPIVFHCLSGKRSAEACAKIALELPSLELYSLKGGITAWIKAGYNTKKSCSYIIPIERQTQIAAGTIAFLGTCLGTFAHDVFYIIPSFIGLGLVFAGLTGWCGMAKFLVKMPWNK